MAYPTFVSSARTSETLDASSHSVLMPPTVSNGDTIIVMATIDKVLNTYDFALPAGFTGAASRSASYTQTHKGSSFLTKLTTGVFVKYNASGADAGTTKTFTTAKSGISAWTSVSLSNCAKVFLPSFFDPGSSIVGHPVTSSAAANGPIDFLSINFWGMHSLKNVLTPPSSPQGNYTLIRHVESGSCQNVWPFWKYAVQLNSAYKNVAASDCWQDPDNTGYINGVPVSYGQWADGGWSGTSGRDCNSFQQTIGGMLACSTDALSGW
jgi:hypothetical protein